jgi:hypothetical protein
MMAIRVAAALALGAMVLGPLDLTRGGAGSGALGAGTAYAQTAPPAQTPPQTQTQTLPPATTTPNPAAPPAEGALPATPAQLDKIKKAIAAPSVIPRTDERLRFYMEIIGRQPTFEKFLFPDDDLINGPVSGAPMTHAEFLGMVTPRHMYGSAGITATDLLQFGVVNWATQSAIKKLKEMREARSFQEVQEIRARIDKELAALRGGG